MRRGKVATPHRYPTRILTADRAFPPQRPSRKIGPGTPKRARLGFGTQLWPMMTLESCYEAARLHEVEYRSVGCPCALSRTESHHVGSVGRTRGWLPLTSQL